MSNFNSGNDSLQMDNQLIKTFLLGVLPVMNILQIYVNTKLLITHLLSACVVLACRSFIGNVKYEFKCEFQYKDYIICKVLYIQLNF